MPSYVENYKQAVFGNKLKDKFDSVTRLSTFLLHPA